MRQSWACVRSLPVDLLEHSLSSNFAKVVTESHADELVHGPKKERENEPSEPCPAAQREIVPVLKVEYQKRSDVKHQGRPAAKRCRDERTEEVDGGNVPKQQSHTMCLAAD
jgi:hypothetical protein